VPTASGIPSWRTYFQHLATCETPDCDFFVDGKNGKGAGANHAKQTGHLVRVESHQTTYYGEEHPGEHSDSLTPK